MYALLGVADPSVTAASTAITTFVTDNSVSIFALILLLAAFGWALHFVSSRIRHIA